jgi:mRNA deadenylase 3'-5' endonuclease subunit Ccr4
MMFLFWLLLSVLIRRVPSIRRPFISIPNKIGCDVRTSTVFRVMQFNLLADGLSGLRPDRGMFSYVNRDPHILWWPIRRTKLLAEIDTYSPDILTVQEMDHFSDFFQPELAKRGYTGYFAPKPTSAWCEH